MPESHMPEEGSEAPDFTPPDQDGDEVTLSGLRGQPVVLYFYPKADTPGCTTQACGIRDHRSRLRADRRPRDRGLAGHGCGASGSSPRSTDLDFTLLADEDHEVAELYGVWGEKKMYGKTYMGVQRATFLIDPEGKVASIPEGLAEDPRRGRARGARRA